MLIPDTTIITQCFFLEPYFDESKKKYSRTLEEMVYKNGEFLLSTPAYMYIFCDEYSYSHIFKVRNEKYQLGHLTYYNVLKFEDTWAYQYKDEFIKNKLKIKSNFQESDLRTNWSLHLCVANCLDFIKKCIIQNHFNTSSFLYIDINIYKIIKNEITNKEEYKYFNDNSKLNFLKILNNIPDKFHINCMGVINKKFLKDENLDEFYKCKRYFVSGGLITLTNTQKNIEIINSIQSNFIKHLNLGYGHGFEMLFVDIFDKYYDDIIKSYGDYWDIINNYFEMKTNQKYIIDYIIRPNLRFKYYKECIDVCDYFINSIENLSCSINFENYFYALYSKYVAAFYYDKKLSLETLIKIRKNIELIPDFRTVYLSNKDFYDKEFSFL